MSKVEAKKRNTRHNKLRAETHFPNKKTRKAMREVKQITNPRFKNAKEVFQALDK